MAKKLVIKNGAVENIIEAHDDFTLEGCEIVNYQDGANIGYHWDGEKVIIPDPEPIPKDVLAESVRLRRNALLADTDWIVIMHTEKGTNIPMEWEIYRQALRDITAQEGFPFNVTWPEKPTS